MSLFIVGTDIDKGEGGISSSLRGFLSYRSLAAVAKFVPSHIPGRKLKSFITAYVRLAKCRKGDVIWLHCGPWFSILRKTALVIYPKLRGARVVYHMHSPTFETYLRNFITCAVLRMVFKLADKVVVLTPYWQTQVDRHLPSVSKKVVVLANPLDSVFSQKAKTLSKNLNLKLPPLKSEEVKLLTLARLVPEKNVGLVIQALEKLPKRYQLVIGGSGKELNALKNLTAELGLQSRVQFLGWVGYQEKIELFKKCDIFCLPSNYDSFGMSFIEAMAFGLPVVALEQGAVKDIVLHEQCGFLCKEQSITEVVAGVENCLSNYSLYSTNSVKHVYSNYLLDQVAIKALEMYERLKNV